MIRAIISPIAHSTKPLIGGKTKASFFWHNAITEIPDIETVLEHLFTGHAITPAYVLQSLTDKLGPSNQSIFVSQQLWLVDLDNHKLSEAYPLGVDVNLTVEDVLEFCSEHELNPFVIYETLSSTIQVPRFRVGFNSTEIVTDLEKRNLYVSALIELFEQRYRYVDNHCKDLGRFYYGTTIDKVDNSWFDVEAVTDFNHILQNHHCDMSSSHDGCSKDRFNLPLLHPSCEAFIVSDEVDVRYHAANCVPFELFSHHRFAENFCCEFHQDTLPSARIETVKGKYNGEYRYACYCSDCHVYLSPVEYVIRTKGCSKAEALTYLLGLQDIPVYPEFWENLHTTHPDACRILGVDRGNGKGRNGSDQIMVSITRAAKLGIEVDGEVLFPLADKSIAQDLIEREVFDVSPVAGNIQPKRVRLCYLGLLRPVDDTELGRINPAGLKHFRDLQARKGRSRRCNWYTISTTIPVEEQLRKACLIATDLSQGGSTGPMTHDVVTLNAGTKKANGIFVQDQDKELSQSKERLVDSFSSELRRQVEEVGWSTKHKVRDSVFHRSYGIKERILNQCWYSIIKENGYRLVVINQLFREQLNIPKEVDRGSKIVVKSSLNQ